MTEPNSRLAKLELNSKLYRYNANLERYADMFTNDPAAWQKLPVLLQDASGQYLDARNAYRAAVDAGAIPDDRGPKSAPSERTSSW